MGNFHEMDDKVIEVWSRYKKMQNEIGYEYKKYFGELLTHIAQQGGTVKKETIEKYSIL